MGSNPAHCVRPIASLQSRKQLHVLVIAFVLQFVAAKGLNPVALGVSPGRKNASDDPSPP